jgi:uncharacterized protein (DUF305 family)
VRPKFGLVFDGNTFGKMMNDMAVKPTGDVDHDFVAMMTQHHQCAIDMAEAELRYGHNEQLIRIAQALLLRSSRRSRRCAPPWARS